MKAWNSTLNVGKPLRRSGRLRSRSKLKARRRTSRYTIEQRSAMSRELWEDRGGKCERCGRPAGATRFNDHHVVPKRKPYNGSDDLSNRKLLCSSLDYPEGGCHEWAEAHPAEARKLGLLCEKWERWEE